LAAKFRRQHPIDPHVVDFYCHESSLVIEIDGAVHADRASEDAERQAILESTGFTFLRVTADKVEGDMAAVVRRITTEVMRRLALIPDPSSRPMG
jgi:very-short-patch-repair endonuclease